MKLNVTPTSKHAFSLVELSIVLVVLGLLVGGVLSGRSLIRAAELRSISTQYNQFYTATKAFRDKYFALPGDMNNATRFWGQAGVTIATCATTAITDARTCDGDGNGSISTHVGSVEYSRYWQHLANAGLIEGTNNGMGDIYGPKGKLKNTYWVVYDYGQVTSLFYGFFEGNYGNTLTFGTPYCLGDVCTGVPPEEAWNIDQKMDDGKPGTGKLVIDSGLGLASCTDTSSNLLADALTAQYIFTNTSADCALKFRQQF